MPLSKIKAEFQDKYIAFGKSKKKLGERQDIDDLAILAHQSGDESIEDLFETLPPLADLQKAKTDADLKSAPAPTTKEVAKAEAKK